MQLNAVHDDQHPADEVFAALVGVEAVTAMVADDTRRALDHEHARMTAHLEDA